MGRTARLNTGRSAEFADSAGGSENGIALTSTQVSYTGGVEGFGAIADVTGVTFDFDLTVAGLVQFFASGASLSNPFTQGNYLGLAININGTDYYLNGTGEQAFNAAGGGNLCTGGFTGGNAISGALALNLTAGSYTVKLRAFGSGYLKSSASFPTRLIAVYPTISGDVEAIATLTRQEVGPFSGSRNTIAAEYQEFGTPISVTLSAPQVVMVGAYAHFLDPGSNSVTGQLGVRVTSPGPSVVEYEGSMARGGNDVNYANSSLFRAVSLPIGTHTFELIARDPASGAVIEWGNAFLTVVYNSPQEVVGGLDVLTLVKADGTAHYQTIQDALDAGAYYILASGEFIIDTTIELPDADVEIIFAPGSTVTVVGDIPLFKILDGLTAERLYKFTGRPIFIGDPDADQTLFQLDDANGFGKIEYENAKIDGFSTYVNWSKYDESYTNQSVVRGYKSILTAILGGSTLVTTPQAAGSYFAGVALKFVECDIFGWYVPAVSYDSWTGDADCDIWLDKCSYFYIDAGSKFNGLNLHSGGLTINHAGDVEFNGNGWDIYDYLTGGAVVNSLQIGADAADARLITWGGSIDAGQFVSVALKVLSTAGVQVRIRNCYDNIGLTHPGIEIANDNAVVYGTKFQKQSSPVNVFAQGCIKISGKSFCKIHDNHFHSSVTGKAVIEVAPGDNNLVHDNTGTTINGGMTLVGAVTIANEHNNI